MKKTRLNNFRIIPRLDIKNDTVIKGIHLEGLRVVGEPAELTENTTRMEQMKSYIWMLWLVCTRKIV